jgi:hypothetical protein
MRSGLDELRRTCWTLCCFSESNPLNVELNPICHLLALLGAHHILHVGRIRGNVFFKKCSVLKNMLGGFSIALLSASIQRF